MKTLKDRLNKEFKQKGYGLKQIKAFSEEAQKYLIDRHNRGLIELKRLKEYPLKTGDSGYTRLLGMWRYTKSKGLDASVGLKTAWMATILNNDLI